MPLENISFSGTYKYFFNVLTPNVHNALGVILSDAYYLFTDPDSGNKTWRPPAPVYKAKEDIFDYQQFVKSQGFYCLILIEVVSLNGSKISDDPALYAFHDEIRLANKNEQNRWLQWFNTVSPRPHVKMDLSDARYVAKEDLSIIEHFPYAPKNIINFGIAGTFDLTPKRPITAIYTPE